MLVIQKREFIKLIFIFLIIVSFNASSNDIIIPNYSDLKVKQFGKEWCWAATLEAVYKFKNKPVSQLEIMQGYTRRTREDLIQNKDSFFLGIHSKEFINKYLKGFKSIKKNEILNSLKNQNIIIMINQNHVSLIIGYYNNQYVIMEPWEGRFVYMNPKKIQYMYKDRKHKENSQFFEVDNL